MTAHSGHTHLKNAGVATDLRTGLPAAQLISLIRPHGSHHRASGSWCKGLPEDKQEIHRVRQSPLNASSYDVLDLAKAIHEFNAAQRNDVQVAGRTTCDHRITDQASSTARSLT